MKKKQHIHISIEFNEAILPVIECEDGHQRVPLKPIADQIGINWRTFTRRIDVDNYLNKRLGIYMMPSRGHQKEEIHVRIDRVTAFLNSLNPEKIRAKDNHDTADWLEAKHAEWDDALHSYETTGMAFKVNHAKEQSIHIKSFIEVSKLKLSTENQADRKVLSTMMRDMAEKSGYPYQEELEADS